MKKIWLSSPHLGEEEIGYVNEAFRSNWIAPLGPNVDGFENDLEQFLGMDMSAAALSSGTAAIHLALILLGVGPGDEVICQSKTFCGSSNPILYQRAVPIFVDSEKDTWNMSPEYLEIAIKDRIRLGKKPKAIIVVHLYGMPAHIEKISAIAKVYDIPVIEDAAEALGSCINNRPCGTFGDISVLSFNGNKIITTSGGGALLSSNHEFVKMAKFLSTQARDQAVHYEHSQVGYNYRLSNVCAGIGRGQMKVLDDRVIQRRLNFERYKILLDGLGLSFNEEPVGYFSNRWLSTFLVTKEANITSNELISKLGDKNIEARPLWKPMHMQPVFKGCIYYGEDVSASLFESGICLPSGTNMTEDDWNYIENSLMSILK